MDREPNGSYTKISKFLSRILRHSPSAIHLTLDANGWAVVDELVYNANVYRNMGLTPGILREVVATNDKQRFKLSEDGKRIRASQGHSVAVDLGLERQKPPPVLYHGTARGSLASILKDGLQPMSRQYVHLSITCGAALTVGKRHGKAVALDIAAEAMHEDGYSFYLSENNVWLTDEVPPKYITMQTEDKPR